ncbi:hypothetical protein H2200_008885 [Cladophialophora chaetospira]|uniref:Survival motor neuron Tudor domain-containing protein n=1 Tax=Cladophialophora chaetospira TaxID=386627 RepID=A0AA38X5B6_9EURO|nr:hypothetical protein H2200_008885 [Cladophialophora chaetospira]
MAPRKKKQKKHHSGQNGSLSQAEIWDDSALIQSWNDALAEYDYYHSIHARGEDVEEILRKAEAGELDYEDDDQQTNGGWQPADKGVKTVDAAARLDDSATVVHHQALDDEEDEEGEVVEDETLAKAQEARSLESARRTARQTLNSAVEGMADQQREEEPPPATEATERPSGAASAPLIGPSLPPADVATSIRPHTEAAPRQLPSQDPTLENIKMAYYWAGYYSGLFDGQRQAQIQAQPHAPT